MNLYLIFCFFFSSLSTYPWKYVKGNEGNPDIAVTGETFEDGNHPGSTACSSTWSDGGMFYIYGGTGVSQPPVTTIKVLSALWRFDANDGNYAFTKGFYDDLERRPVYSSIDEYDFQEENEPGSRYGSVVIEDPHEEEDREEIYIFGGRFDSTGGSVNKTLYGDIWCYSMPNNQWKLVTGEYSKMTNFSSIFSGPDTRIGARYLSSVWKRGHEIFIFGGHGYVSDDEHGRLSDLFKFDVPSGEWTFIMGNEGKNVKTTEPDEVTQRGVPGGRSEAMSWQFCDTNYLFAGWGFGINSLQYTRLSDMWKWREGDGYFTFVSGSLTGGFESMEVRGETNVFDESNIVGPRYGSGVWSFGEDFVLIFGGRGQGGQPTFESDFFYADFWVWSNRLEMWKFVGGEKDNVAGGFGDEVYSVDNIPGGRYCVGHFHYGREFYVFGGIGWGQTTSLKLFLNDLYSFEVSEEDHTNMTRSCTCPGDDQDDDQDDSDIVDEDFGFLSSVSAKIVSLLLLF